MKFTPIDYAETDEHRMIQDTARKFLADNLTPIAAEIEQYSKALLGILSAEGVSDGDAEQADALTENDWQTVQNLDNGFRQSIELLIQQHPLTEAEKAGVAQSVMALQLLYKRLIVKCEDHRSEIKKELMHLRKGRAGIKSYQG